MVWQYINFLTLIKKGLLLTVIRIQGTAEARRCDAVAVRSQVITWSSTLTLYALYLPRLPPPPPHTSSAPSFSGSGAYRHPRYSYTWYTGVSQNNFLWQKYLAFTFLKNLSNLLFLCRSAPVHFCNILCQKMHSLSHQPLTRESFSRSFFRCSFSPFLNKCQLFMSKDFWNLPVNPVCRVPGFMKGGKGR